MTEPKPPRWTPSWRKAETGDATAVDVPLADHVRRTHGDPVLRRLMLLVSVAVVLGLVGTAAAVVGATQTRNASRADVQRAAALTADLQRQQEQAERRTYAVRTDNRVLLNAICDQIEAVRDAVPALRGNPAIQDCPVLDPIPEPRSEPGPVASPTASR